VAGTDHQVILAVEQEAQRESPTEAGNGALDGGQRVIALIHVVAGQDDDGFGVGLRFKSMAKGLHFLTNFAEVLDDAVVDDRDLARTVWVRILDGDPAMAGPAGLSCRARARGPEGRTG
jgi:hypothetical protein